ncbi:MAG: hypothetical protein LC789_08535 [Actinobacteria bacterium]|nr:hypothetical protein [Actinomycetota bacterium]MCA1722215.1 hypothetical protein [Actinomycetota bacterium]
MPAVERSALLPVLAFGGAAWAVLPPYVGPSVAAAGRAEVADHVVPAAVLAMTAAVLLLVRATGTALFAGGLVTLLAGLWMTATHLPLLRQADAGVVTWPAAIHHSLPGVALLGLGALWCARTHEAAAVRR